MLVIVLPFYWGGGGWGGGWGQLSVSHVKKEDIRKK